MNHLKKVYDHNVYNWFDLDIDKPAVKIYLNTKENFYFSEGYPGGINWEFHPDSMNLKIFLSISNL